jgi:hypothetical protein
MRQVNRIQSTKDSDKLRLKGPDIKENIATLLIQHNLLHGKTWERFHQDNQVLVEKYHPKYEKGLRQWFKDGKTNNI